MKALWRKYAVKIDALASRERVMVFVAAVTVTLFLINMLFIEPAAARKKTLRAQAAQQQSTLATMQVQIDALEKKISDPDAANAAKRDDIVRQIAQIDATLKGMQQRLVPAENMKALLQQMLARNPRLQLVSLRTLPVTPLIERGSKPEASVTAGAQSIADDGAVFKHGVQITLEGSYADLHDYLDRLEKLSARMFWSRAMLNAENYPRTTLTITIYTLSPDRAWLVV